MPIQAYIDDSSQDDRLYVLAGHVASSETWASFREDWRDLLPLSRLGTSGIRRFKMNEIRLDAEGMWRVKAFYNVINRGQIVSIAAAINRDELRLQQESLYVPWHSMGVEPPLNWGPLGNPFFILFRMLLEGFQGSRSDFEPVIPANEAVHFIFDETREQRTVREAWQMYVEARPPQTRRLFGDCPRFESDEVFLPLQAADLWAWWTREDLKYERGLTADKNALVSDFLCEIHAAPRVTKRFAMDSAQIAQSLLFFARESYARSTEYSVSYVAAAQ